MTTVSLETTTAKMKRSSRLFMLAAFLVAGAAFIVIAWGGINKNLVYYWTPTDLVANGDKAYGATIRLGGMVSGGSIKNHAGDQKGSQHEPAGAALHFGGRRCCAHVAHCF